MTTCFCVIFAFSGAVFGCATSNTNVSKPAQSFPAPPAMVDSKIEQIPDPALRMRVMADMAHMRAAATGSVPAPTKQ